MRYIVEVKDPNQSSFYGLESFPQAAYAVGREEAAKRGLDPEAYAVHELTHAGPKSLSEWLLQVILEIQKRHGVTYAVDTKGVFTDTKTGALHEVAMAELEGAKLAIRQMKVSPRN